MSQLQLFVEAVNQFAIFLLDSVGRITSWNCGAEKIYGHSPAEILDQSCAILYPDKEAHTAEVALQAAALSGSYSTFLWQERKDGSRFWAHVVLTPIFQSGDLCGFGHITEDRTDALRASEMYRSVMNSLRTQIAVVDDTGTILMVNDAWNRFAIENGTLLESAAVGINYLDLCREKSGEGAEFAARALDGLQAVLQQDRDEFTMEYLCPSETGERWYLLSITPFGFNGGGAVLTHADVTERVKAEQKLRGSEEHYRALIDNEVDVVTILEPDGTVCFESPALERILGYKPEELVGRNAFDFINPADVPRVKEEVERTLSSNEPSRPIEFAFRHKDGGWRILESVARNLLSNPAVRGIIVNSRDITARREAEAALRTNEAALKASHEQLQALTGRLLEAEERERRRLSRELHDDLNQKLAVLAVDLGALGRALRTSGSEEVERELRDMQTRIVRISDEVRTMAYQLHPSVLDHLGLAVALRSYCAEFAKREDMVVKFHHRNVNGFVTPEIASCIYRITQEALRNIAKHANTNRASVSLVRSATRVTLKIRDWGAGFRTDVVRLRPSLGLTSMTERARQIGGELTIESSPGSGTTLTVHLPWTPVSAP